MIEIVNIKAALYTKGDVI